MVLRVDSLRPPSFRTEKNTENAYMSTSFIGYSFNDSVIRDIFMKNSNEKKQIVLLHPHANDIAVQKLGDIKCKDLRVLEKKFGMHHDYTYISQDIVSCLK